MMKKNNKNSTNPLSKLFSGMASFFAVIFGILYAILEGISRATSNNSLGNTNNNNTSPSQQTAGHYQCLCGYIQHGSHWGGMRNCPQCGKPMTWRN
jgi:hypothetical protein